MSPDNRDQETTGHASNHRGQLLGILQMFPVGGLVSEKIFAEGLHSVLQLAAASTRAWQALGANAVSLIRSQTSIRQP